MSKINVRKLSKEDKRALKVKALAALEMNKGNTSKTAREMNIARPSLLNWKREHDTGEVRSREVPAAEVAETVKEVEQTLRLTEDKLDELATLLVGSLIRDVRGGEGAEKANFYQRSGTFNIIFPALQILRGNPTSISETVAGLPKRERAERVRALLTTAHERRQAMKIVPTETNGNKKNGTQP